MDGSIAAHCAATGTPEPTVLEDRMQLHLQLLYEAVLNLEEKHDEAIHPD